jgi:hypothetical protein
MWTRIIMGNIIKHGYDNQVLFFLTQFMYHILCTYLIGYLLEAPREYIRHGLILGLDWAFCQFSSAYILLVCLGILLFVPTIHVSHTHPLLPTGQLNTGTQVNNMAVLHLIYVVTHIYITFTLLFISLFILLLHLWAGWLAPSLLVGNKNFTL